LIAWEFTCTVSFKDARARSAVLKGRARSCAGRNSELGPPVTKRQVAGYSSSTRGGRPTGHGIVAMDCRTARGCQRHPVLRGGKPFGSGGAWQLPQNGTVTPDWWWRPVVPLGLPLSGRSRRADPGGVGLLRYPSSNQ